jgi:hypothetical protein
LNSFNDHANISSRKTPRIREARLKIKKVHIPWPVVVCALFVFVLTNVLSYFLFDHIPHVHDEIDYLFQAKIFTQGKLYMPSPPAKEFFDFPHIINNGRWYSQYTPGYPFLLLLGLVVGAPWILNPLLAAFSIVFFYFLGRELFNKTVGLIASILGAISIWFLLMSSTMMSHTSCMFFLTLFLLFLFRSLKNPSVANGIFTALAIGMALLIRPYTAFLVAFPFLVFYTVNQLAKLKSSTKNVAAFTLTMILMLSILMAYNTATNGDPLRMGYIVCYGKEVLPGFGISGCYNLIHTPYQGALNTGIYLKSLNFYLFGWPFSLVLALLPLLILGRVKPDYRKKIVLLCSGFICLMVGYFFYWGTVETIGPRFYFEGIPLLILLSALGLYEIPRFLSSRFKKPRPQVFNKVLIAGMIVLAAYGLFYRFPRLIWPPNPEWFYDTYADDFAGVTPKINHTLRSLPLTNAVVSMKMIHSHIPFFQNGSWGSGFLFTDPELRGEIIYARELEERAGELLKAYPKREHYIYFGTLKKGFLIPREIEGKQIFLGKPIHFSGRDRKDIELLSDPLDLYKIYSPDFKYFLEELYAHNDLLRVDTSFLIRSGHRLKDLGEYRKAAFFYEAALQLEQNPENRYEALNNLSPCYLKLGRGDDAEKIFTALRDRDKPTLFHLFPERGF